MQCEVTIEHVQDCFLEQFVDHLFFVAIAHRFQLDFAAGALSQRDEVGNARCDLLFVEANCAPQRIRQHIFIVGDADPHADARTLRDLGALAREVGDLGDNLAHVGRHERVVLLIAEDAALLLHDVHFMLDSLRIVRPDLRTETVLERRDDAPAVGVILRVSRSDDE